MLSCHCNVLGVCLADNIHWVGRLSSHTGLLLPHIRPLQLLPAHCHPFPTTAISYAPTDTLSAQCNILPAHWNSYSPTATLTANCHLLLTHCHPYQRPLPPPTHPLPDLSQYLYLLTNCKVLSARAREGLRPMQPRTRNTFIAANL